MTMQTTTKAVGEFDPLDMNNYKIEKLPKMQKSKFETWLSRLGGPLAIIVFVWICFFCHIGFIDNLDTSRLAATAQKRLDVLGVDGFLRANYAMLAIFAASLILWMTEAIPNYLTSLLLILGTVLFGVTTQKEALAQLGHPVMWLNILSFVLASMLVKTQFAKRLALAFVIKFGRSAKGVLWSFLLINLVLSAFISATTVKATIMLPIFMVICAIYGASNGNRNNFGRNLVIQNLFQVNIGANAFYTGSGAHLLAISLIAGFIGSCDFGYANWLVAVGPMSVIILVVGLLLGMYVFFPMKKEEQKPQIEGGIERLKVELDAMGKMTAQEWRAVIIFLIVLVLWERNGEYKIFGSVAEMEEFFGVKIDDLHRPTLDNLTKDGWHRITDVLDCWFESGSMPFAQLHYPFENKDKFEKSFPADYIIEGQDQTRGWFYSLMVVAVALFDKPAFRVVSANGMILDEQKRKFAKSLHNYSDPSEQFETYGADAIRLFIQGSNFMKAEGVCVDKEGKVFNDSIKTILTPLWNAYHFFTLYANAGNITVEKEPDGENLLDKYILSELNELITTTTKSLNEYKPDIAVKEFVRFLDILNNWYIRRNRDRFWDEDESAFETLHYVLVNFCKVLAPFAPFISEYIFKNLTGLESVHLEDWPTAENTDTKILNDMRRIQMIVSTGKQLREQYKLRNRLPLADVTIAGINMEDYADIIRDELNVKEVKFVDNIKSVADSFVYLITPKIGARLGGALKDIIPAVKRGDYTIDGDKLIVGEYTLNMDEFENRLTVKEGVTGAALSDNTAVVVLNTETNGELLAEGLVNDALRFIQDSRKAAGLDVSDRIKMTITADFALFRAIEAHKKRIMHDALIVEMNPGMAEQFTTTIEEYNFAIDIEKVK